MESKSNFNKLIYGIIAILLVIIIAVAARIAVKNGRDAETVNTEDTESITGGIVQGQEAEISEIEEGDLPLQ